MKKIIFIFAFLHVFFLAHSQENKFIISGGYVFANIEEVDTDASGWRINGTYEFNPSAGKFSHGFTLGYTGTSADFTSNTATSNYKINSWPIYYAPKFTIGTGSLKAFVKGALGTHVTSYKRTGTLTEIKTTDMGFYGGAAAGGILIISDKIFITAEYEWAYMSNSYYRDGFINSATAGIGISF